VLITQEQTQKTQVWRLWTHKTLNSSWLMCVKVWRWQNTGQWRWSPYEKNRWVNLCSLDAFSVFCDAIFFPKIYATLMADQ